MTEIEALQNLADGLDLKISEKLTQDKRATVKKYYATLDGIIASPVFDYTQMNSYLLGWSRCKKILSAPIS